MNIKIIIPFFGKLPDYFDFFLEFEIIIFYTKKDPQINESLIRLRMYYLFSSLSMNSSVS